MDWDARYAAGDTPWEKGAPAPPLLEWLDAGHRLAGDVLVPGCGSGHDVRALAARAGARRVVGFDLSEHALRLARAFPQAGDEEYRLGDWFNLPADLRGAFDWVFEHTCFCAISPTRRPDYVRAVADALRPDGDGRLLAIFYLEPWNAGEPLPPGGGPPFGATVGELDALFAPAFHLLEERRPTRAYPGREGRELLRLYQKIHPARAAVSSEKGGSPHATPASH